MLQIPMNVTATHATMELPVRTRSTNTHAIVSLDMKETTVKQVSTAFLLSFLVNHLNKAPRHSLCALEKWGVLNGPNLDNEIHLPINNCFHSLLAFLD